MTRPWWMAVGPLLAWGMLLSACNGPPCTVAPFLGGRVVAQNTDGTFSMSWSEVQAIATATDFAPEVGEVGHLLQPVEHGTTADIAPTRRDWSALPDPATYSNELNKMGCGQITAQVTASGPHAPLGFAAGLNYLVVWLDWQPNKLIGGKWTTFHMAAVNESSRKQYETPRYTPHWAFTNTGPIDSTKAKLSPSALQCVNATLKACFVDSENDWKAGPSGPSPIGAGFVLPTQFYASQPWTACVLFGCCCGGKQCHI